THCAHLGPAASVDPSISRPSISRRGRSHRGGEAMRMALWQEPGSWLLLPCTEKLRPERWDEVAISQVLHIPWDHLAGEEEHAANDCPQCLRLGLFKNAEALSLARAAETPVKPVPVPHVAEVVFKRLELGGDIVQFLLKGMRKA